MNYYEVLGLKKEASSSEIKKAYRNLVKKHHPDVGGSEDKFKSISEAYDTLNDSTKKKEYDIKNSIGSNSGFYDMFRTNNGDFSNMFDDVFNQRARGNDITIRVKLTLQEVFSGTIKRIDTGRSAFNVNIPKGLLEGAKLKLNGKGLEHPVNSSAPRGDVILIMNIMPDPDMIVTDGDIWMDCYLPFYDMLLGRDIEVTTKVNSVKIKVPRNSFDGKVLRIIGMGFPIYNTNKYGNMMVKLRASNVTLNEKQLEHVQKIKELENE